MSDIVSIAPRPERGLRLEEMLVSALAPPPPSTPLAAPPGPAEIEADAATIDSHDRSAEQPSDPHAQATDEAVHLDASPAIASPDAIDGSLQASLEAIQVSLTETAGHAEADANVTTPQEAPIQTHPAGTQIMPIGAVEPAISAAAEAILRPAAPEPMVATTSPMPAATEGLVTPVAETAAAVLQVPDVAQLIAPVADAATHLTGDHLSDVLTDAAQPINDLLGSVMVPSLDGSGFDALAGLLPQPATLVSFADVHLSDLADTALLSLPIGLGEDHHVDGGTAHASHPSLPLVGSGLI